MALRRVLIANRGEIAVRIVRTLADLDLTSIAIHSLDDADSLHCSVAHEIVALPGHGARAYLDQTAIIAAAITKRCDAIHPGYGFLAESAMFAEACQDAGLIFVGPSVEQLRLFGDKIAARQLAAKCGVSILEGSPALANAADIAEFQSKLGVNVPVVLKAAAGGGGRGMQVLWPDQAIASAFAGCATEAKAAFGDGTLYAERYIPLARHIEVQILGDGTGAIVHLWERDCSLQRRHQKLIEIAPAPALAATLRDQLIAAATRMAQSVQYRGLGTFEFLVDVAASAYWFIETNPRLQVEHTVTEEVLGLDLVALQFDIARGRTLADLSLNQPPPAPRTSAIQLRINAETFSANGSTLPSSGTITRFAPTLGPGVRVDSAAYMGYSLNSSFDSLCAKLIVRGNDLEFAALARRAERAAAEFQIHGVETNLPLLRAILGHPDVLAEKLTTRWVETNAAALSAAATELTQLTTVTHDDSPPPLSPTSVAPPGTFAVVAPLRGSVIGIEVVIGATVKRGETLAVLEAMKMHHLITAPNAGVVEVIVATPGMTLGEGEAVLYLTLDREEAEVSLSEALIALDAPRADLDEVRARHALTLDANRPEAVAKRRKTGSRTARENVEAVCDPESFTEYGALIIAAQRRRRSIEDLQRNTPADGLVGGIGTVNAAHLGADDTRCMVLAYDYTVLAGTQGVKNHKKKDRLFELALEWKLPVVFFTEGGGGRPGDVDVDDIISAWLDLPTFTTWPQLSGVAPRIAINSGRCFAGNAVIFGCADITIATANSNIGLAGPAMIEGGGLGRFTPEDIGPIDVQTANGVVDIAVRDELEGAAIARKILGCFQGRWPAWQCADQRRLRHVIPENRLRVYAVRTVIDTLADTDSVIEFRRAYGVGLITALIRIEGEAFGLIANDPRHLGGAIDGPGAEKGARFLQLCDAYGLPVVSLCDTPGFMVGPDSEKTAAVRRGSRLIVAGANLTVPLFTVVMRKGYGLGAQAMAGGSFFRPLFTIAWPSAEFGPMGLEGAVQLGFRKELEAEPDPVARKALYERLLAGMYTRGKAVSVASQLEVDAVIDPAETRQWLLRGLRASGPRKRGARRVVDVW